MYRIRLASGEEAVYRSLAELTQAITAGTVGADAEVFHRAGRRWLPIQTHPDYRMATRSAEPVPLAPPPPEVAAVSASDPPVFLTPDTPDQGGTEPPASVGPDTAEPPGPLPAEQSLPPLPPNAYHSPTRTQRLRIMLSLTMVVAVLGAKIGFDRFGSSLSVLRPGETRSAGMPPVPDSIQPAGAPAPESGDAPPENQEPVTPPAPLMAPRTDSFRVVYPAPAPPLPPRATRRPGDEGSLPTESRVITRLRESRSRMPSYYEAYADARAEMDESLSYVGFRRVFAPSRFTSAESLRAGRRMVAAAGNIMKVYRGAEVMLEQTYHPDAADANASLRERFETSEATRELLWTMDSLYALLIEQHDQSTIGPDGVRFDSPSVAQRYGELREEIVRTVHVWSDSAEGPQRVTVPRVLRGIGTILPPALR